MVTAYQAAGYDFCALSDHNTFNYVDFFPLVTDPEIPGILFIVGVEANCNDVGSGHVHYVCVGGITEQIVSIVSQTVIVSVDWAHIAHPMAVDWGGITQAEIEALTGVYALVIREETGYELWDALLTNKTQIYGISEDDSHAVAEVGTRGWIVVYADALAWANILASLQAGKFYASDGPVISAITEDGSKLTITTTTNCNFTFYGRDSTVYGYKANSTSVAYAYDGKEGYIRCYIVEVGTNKRAWTNAIMFS